MPTTLPSWDEVTLGDSEWTAGCLMTLSNQLAMSVSGFDHRLRLHVWATG